MLFLFTSAYPLTGREHSMIPYNYIAGDVSVKGVPTANVVVRKLNQALYVLLKNSMQNGLTKMNAYRSITVIDSILKKIEVYKDIDSTLLSESYYFIGVYYTISKKYFSAIKYLDLSVAIYNSLKIHDKIYIRALYNLGVAYNGLGDFNKHEYYSTRSLEAEKRMSGDKSPALVDTYSSLVTASILLQEYEKAINYSNIALDIGNNNPDSVPPVSMANLYNNLGVCYSRLADFSKAKVFLERAESIYKDKHLAVTDNYINLLNNMAISYGNIKDIEKSDMYYKKGVAQARFVNSSSAYNIINSYAIILGNSVKPQEGEALIGDVLGRAKKEYGEDSRNYIEVLNNYAEYLREYKIDNNKSLVCYTKCLNYLDKNPQDYIMKASVLTGYSLSLNESGRSTEALKTIQSLLFTGNTKLHDSYDNPDPETIKPDRTSLKVLKAKYKILSDIFKKTQDIKTLEAASNTVEFMVSLLEKVRINISEEESRLILGDRFRDSYLNAISNFNLLYIRTDSSKYLDKAFEYSEKSKVAGLLTSTRELKASQFHIPSGISDLEKNLQREIGLFNARISEEISGVDPDTVLIAKWKENLLTTIRVRDSLIKVFEKQYPDYYSIKYNTRVADIKDIPEIVGRNGNYINYVVSDTILYISIVNRKQQKLLAIPVDSVFFNNIRNFRSLLALPSSSGDAKAAFANFQSIGSELNRMLIDPVRPYLISEKLIISPDNILSYVPFETIPVSTYTGDRVLYKKLTYLMDDFDISYTYSATFMAESAKRDYTFSNELIAFAPDYPEPIDIQSVLMKRQASMGVLVDLPYAREEAKFVTDITGGKLYMNSEAGESVYKTESGKYDIVHLAMHTLLDDRDPMNSTLIFSKLKDSIEDGFLKTYEIYGIPLKARMVVLSSCNTGTGILSSGEGILSLARGFIYSGAESVVMSMWEIEDRSGTDIVKLFYKNLKNGYSKSVALRKARKAYLKDADQLRSHPYFWSALVVYGNNTPLYISKYKIIGCIVLFILVAIVAAVYLRKRRYS